MNVTFSPYALKQFQTWAEQDKKIFRKIAALIEDIRRDPYAGTGKPEPLKHQYAGLWSRRIDEKNRLVYRITPEAIIILRCLGHYDDH